MVACSPVWQCPVCLCLCVSGCGRQCIRIPASGAVCVYVCVYQHACQSPCSARGRIQWAGWSAGPGQGVGPRLAHRDPSHGRAAARAPLGPGGGRPLFPGRASEHVQSQAPARPPPARPPAVRSAPAPRPLAVPRRLSPDARSPGEPGGSVLCLGLVGPLSPGRPGACGRRGRSAPGTAGLRARRPGEAVAWPPEWTPQPAAIAGESCLPVPQSGPPRGLRAGFYPAGRGQTSLCRRGQERGGAAPALGSGRAGGGRLSGGQGVCVCARRGALWNDRAGAGCARQLPKLNSPPEILRDRHFPRREPRIWYWGGGQGCDWGCALPLRGGDVYPAAALPLVPLPRQASGQRRVFSGSW